MKQYNLKLSLDLIWNLKLEAKNQNKPLDLFVREILEFWKNSSQNVLNKKKRGILKRGWDSKDTAEIVKGCLDQKGSQELSVIYVN